MNKTTNNPIEWLMQLSRSVFFRALKLSGLSQFSTEGNRQLRQLDAEFDEYPPCEMCGSILVTEQFLAADGSRLVECDQCSLWFTSPRIDEATWAAYLQRVTNRSIELTENRLKYGVALPSNIKYVPPFWRRSQDKTLNSIIDDIEKYSAVDIGCIHDVGCGVGFLMQVADKRGIQVTGNELNGYACQVMNERLGLEVYNDTFPSLNIEAASIDAVVMRDYIEHTYHPLADITAAYKVLKPKGSLYVETFHIDCNAFDKLGEKWNMLFWNHVFHFSAKTLQDMITKAGFEIVHTECSYDDPLIKVFAQKNP